MNMIENLINLLEKKYNLVCEIENLYQSGSLKSVNDGKNIMLEIDSVDNEFLKCYSDIKSEDKIGARDLDRLKTKVDIIMNKMAEVELLEKQFEKMQKDKIREIENKIKNVKASPRNVEKYKNFNKKK